VIGAHFDTVDGSPGVDDNASGVIAVLAVAKVLQKCTFTHTITFVAFDQEEKGLLGSKEYVRKALEDHVNVNGAIILDMVGYFSEKPHSQTIPEGMDQLFPEAYKMVAGDEFRGNFLLSVANQNSVGLSLSFDSCRSLYSSDLKVGSLVLPGNGEIAPDFRRSDHASFWDAGFKALYFGDGANTRNVNYHSSTMHWVR